MNRFLISLTTLVFISACGGGGGGGGDLSPMTPAPVVSLSASPMSVLLAETSTLTWSSSNATSCSASGSWSGTKTTSGSEAVTISTAGNNSFTLSCTGAGGSGSASVTVEGYRNTDGVVVDGYISGADVFIDENDDWTKDSNENSTTSDNDGKFTIKYANGNLVSIGGTDLDSQTLLDNLLITHKLTGHSDFKAVTPVTSVAAFMTDAANVNAALGIDSSIDVSIFDPVANKGDGSIYDYLYEKGNQLTVLAYALQNITNDLNTTTETTQDYFKSITEEIEKEYTETNTKVDIETEAFITKALDNVVAAKTLTISDDAKANTTKALSGVMPVIEVKSTNDLTTSVIRFAVSTLQTDIKAIANGTATAETVASYTTDVLTYIATDQDVDANEITPQIKAINDTISLQEDADVEINVLVNDTFVANAPFSFTNTSTSNGSLILDNNLITYIPSADYNGTDLFSYTLSQGDQTSSADVNINIEAVNDEPSINISSILSFVENDTAAVTTISVSDVDNTDEELILTHSGTDGDSFNLSSDRVLSFKESPDYEAKTTYQISLSLTDGTVTVSKDITINIENINDNRPIVETSSMSADENQLSIGTIVVSDADGDPVTASVSGTDFTLSSAGVIAFVSAPNYEIQSTYTAVVTVTDQLFVTSQNIAITVNDVNDAPVFSAVSEFSGEENQGTISGTFTVSDEDGDEVSVSLGGDEADLFQISSDSILSFKSNPDYETKSSYAIKLVASDSELSTSTDINVSVINILEDIISMEFNVSEGTVSRSPVFTANIVLDELMDATKVLVDLWCGSLVFDSSCGENRSERVAAEKITSTLWTVNKSLYQSFGSGDGNRYFNPTVLIKTTNDYQVSWNSSLDETYTYIISSQDLGRINATEDSPYNYKVGSLSFENIFKDNLFRKVWDTAGNSYDYLLYVDSESYGSSCNLLGDGTRMYAVPSDECFQETVLVKDSTLTSSYSNGREVSGNDQLEVSISLYWAENIKLSNAFLFGPPGQYGKSFLNNEYNSDIASNSRENFHTQGVVYPEQTNLVKYSWLLDKGFGNSSNTSGIYGRFFIGARATDFSGNSASANLTHNNFSNLNADEFAPNLESFTVLPEVKSSDNGRLYLNVNAVVNNDNVVDGELSSANSYSSPIRDIWFAITLPNCSEQYLYIKDETSADLTADTREFSRSIPLIENLNLNGDYQVTSITLKDKSGKGNSYSGEESHSSGLFSKFTIGDGSSPTCPVFSASSSIINNASVEVYEGTKAVTTIEAGLEQASKFTTTYSIDEGYGYHPAGLFEINSSTGVLSFQNPAPYIDLTCGVNSYASTCDDKKLYTVAVRATIDNKYTTDPFYIDVSLIQDTDYDGIRNSEDPDDDNDTYLDDDDAFPLDNTEWLDTDSDGTGNNADTDDDNDTYLDDDDAFPLDNTEWLDTDIDGTGNNADTDDDNDGVDDSEDSHPLDPNISDGPVVTSADYYVELRPKSSNGGDIQLEGSQKDGKIVTYSIVTEPENGTAALDPNTGVLTYTTVAINSVLDSLVFKANDGTHDSVHGIITLDLRSDLLYKHAWHLDNTGQNNFATNPGTSGVDLNVDADIASGIDGSGIVVTVIDEGLEIAHEDLVPNIFTNRSWDFVYGDQDPTNPSTTGDHGTSVAGIIAADAYNKIGSRGIAPDVLLIGTNWLNYQTYNNMGLALGYGNHPGFSENLNSLTNIFNMSYGVGLAEDNNSLGGRDISSYERTFFSSGTTNLRNSKGALYVKSSGNGWRDKSYNYCGPNKISSDDMPCSDALLDSTHALPYVIVTGAVNANDLRSSYSTPGASLWISAFGGEYGTTDPAMMTTDQSSCSQGYVREGRYSNSFNSGGDHPENLNCNYTSTFNGTSSAAPTVSGVIALMLEANNTLTWRDVKHILASTSVQVDPTRSKEISGVTQYSWVTNAANYKHHPWYGFGRVDAGAAISASKDYTAGSLGAFTATAKTTFVKDTDDLDIVFDLDSNTTYEISFNQSAPSGTSDFIEFITMSFSLSHEIPQDIGIVLTSPSGTEVTVLTPFTAATVNPLNDSFDVGISGFYGETMEGTWTVSLTEYTDDEIGGTLKEFSIKIYGH